MSETASWQPSASIPNLLKRAAKRWGVITTLSSLCWSGIDRTMICTG